MIATQVFPVTQAQRNINSVLAKLDKGPVILSKGGMAAAVVLSVDEFDRMQNQIAMSERQLAGDRAVEANDWMTDDEVTEAFTKAGVTL